MERSEGLIPAWSKIEGVFVTLSFKAVVLACHAHVSPLSRHCIRQKRGATHLEKVEASEGGVIAIAASEEDEDDADEGGDGERHRRCDADYSSEFAHVGG